MKFLVITLDSTLQIALKKLCTTDPSETKGMKETEPFSIIQQLTSHIVQTKERATGIKLSSL